MHLNKERAVVVLFVVLSGIAGYFLGTRSSSGRQEIVQEMDKPASAPRQIRGEGFNFISPLLECECYEPSKLIQSVALEAKIRKYVNQVVSENKATHVSVYFRDLNNGPWVGINEDELFSPASLLKVPVMIGALKKAETEPGFLKKKFRYEAGMNDSFFQTTDDGKTLEPGEEYDVEYLIHRMIALSDNRAKNLLVVVLGMPFLDRVMIDIQLKIAGTRSPNDMCSVKEYSSFFRILYNASYLNKEMSEKALWFLSQSTFKDGIVAWLPTKVKVAHKFGERGVEGSGNVQLHDCGIVYEENNPYLLCVMTRSTSRKHLTEIIAEVSKIIYEDVSKKE